MRLLIKCTDKEQAVIIDRYLSANEIESKLEEKEDEYLVWILNEDAYESARLIYEQYVKNPEAVPHLPNQDEPPPMVDPHFKMKIRPLMMMNQKRSIMTVLLIGICAFVYITNMMQRTTPSSILLGLTPTTKALLYDFPQPMERAVTILDETKITTQKEYEELPEATKKEIESINDKGYWRGVYYTVLQWPASKQDLDHPLFKDIRKGEVWRVFTPAILHVDFLHILFNMLWLFYLGRMMEERMNVLKYLGVTLVLAFVTNTLQYLMSGPFFMGYSGVVVGLAGFIWMRQRIAPWEGYPLQKGTLLFLMAFVIGMVLLQLTSFIFIRFQIAPFEMNIANTAHISGGLMGMLLGRLSFFNKGVS